MRVKICGITSAQDARMVEDAGADALGLIFAEGSRRQIGLEQAAEIAAATGPFITRVGVFRDQGEDFILEAVERAYLGAVQLHGAAPTGLVAALARHVRVIRAASFRPGLQPGQVYVPGASLLLDAVTPGSGRTFAWEFATAFRDLPGLILAGGLNPSNVAGGIMALRPHAVDVASGVESGPGVKDAGLVHAFIHAARQAQAGQA